MRTKTLLLAAAVSAAGIVALQAQSNVYSQNVVGYYSIVLPATGATANPARAALVAIQLKANGIANPTLSNTITNISRTDGVRANLWSQTAGGFSAPNDWGDIDPSQWGGAQANDTIPYGGGFFLRNIGATPVTITFVGEVPQGALVNDWSAQPNQLYHPAGSQVPQAGLISTALNYKPVTVPQGLASIYTWGIPAGAAWSGINTYEDIDPGVWGNGEPTLTVGQAVMTRSSPTSGRHWNRNFTVQ